MRVRAGSAPLQVVAAGVVAVAIAVAVVSSWPAGARAGATTAPRPPALGTVVLAEIGFGYAVSSQGPLDASTFPNGSPSASAAAGALNTLGNSIETYQRSWQDTAGVNQVQDLVVRFPTVAGARAFIGAARRAIAHAQIASSGPLPSIPGAQRTTYFASTNQTGVGQTITLRRGDYAAVLSFFSGASANPEPITAASAERVAKAQYTAVVSAAGRPVTAKRAGGAGVSAADVGWAVLAVAVLGAAVATPLLLLRRRAGAHEVR
jgi:hypothetical protein